MVFALLQAGNSEQVCKKCIFLVQLKGKGMFFESKIFQYMVDFLDLKKGRDVLVSLGRSWVG